VTLRWLCVVPAFLFAVALLPADGPGDNVTEAVRPVPPPGVAIAAEDKAALQKEIDELGKEIAALEKALSSKPALKALLPDVRIYHNAARYALSYNEFYDKKEVAVAHSLLKDGMERAKQLQDGKAPWTTATGLVPRGYVSKIDGSVQPYGLVVPPSFKAGETRKHRLDLWCHGRGEKLTELSFLDGRRKSPGEFTPPDAFVLHLYGRYCCANKFAGEIDALEAMADVKSHYPIDEDRIVIRGFSMGGAACWQFAVHYPSLWAAAAPGAGFSETARFLDVFQKEKVQPTWYEKKLYHLYDCTDYAANLFNLPVVAYSGEKDRQKQAADVMAEAMKKEGLDLVHIIGPNTEHRYEPGAKKEVIERIDAIVARGRNPVPTHVRFTTWTLRYNNSFWVTIDGLGEHWARADVDAEVKDSKTIKLTVNNVTGLMLAMPAGHCPLEGKPTVVVTDGKQETTLQGPAVKDDRSWSFSLHRGERGWTSGPLEGELRKRHGLQGPIDDAFMESFLIVGPSGKAINDKTYGWFEAEWMRAVDHWRKQFRGEPRRKDDKDVTDADIAAHNLILWGDPSSNKLMARVLEKLPVKWDAREIVVGKEHFDAANHMLLMIYPNPLNPKRYIVLNSGFTFRDYDYLNNARQIPKLPDYAVIDLRTPPSSRWPGGVVAAGFFDEQWRLTDKK
jgi:pimeloyl-ACP methyl ester carboxylesterase